MKKSELLEMFRTVVKEEVNQALPQLLMEVLAEKIVSNETPVKSAAPKSFSGTAPIPASYRKPQVALDAPLRSEVKVPNIFSANSKFGSILNETRGGLPQDTVDDAPSAHDALRAIPQEVLNENRDVAAVANAMTRDYSQMLKTIDAKAKAKRPM
jgi:hypothetical protein